MRVKLSFILLLIFGVFMTQMSAEVIELDLEKARSMALQNNPTVKLAREGVKKAKAQVTEARSGFMPQINAFSNLQHSWDLQENKIPNFLKSSLAPTYTQVGGALKTVGQKIDDQELIQEGQGMINSVDMMPDYLQMAFGLENVFSYGVQLQQPLFTGGSLLNSYKISKISVDIAEAELENSRQSLIKRVTSNYYNTLFAKSAVSVSKAAVKSARENLEQVQKFYDQEKASKLDLLRAEVQLANLKPNLLSAKNRLEMSISQLTTTLGLDEEMEFVFKDSLKYKQSPYLDKSLKELIELATRNRPEMNIIENRKDIVSKQLAMARGSRLPSLNLSTSYQYQGMRNDFDFNSDDFNKSFSTSLSLSIPLFNGFKKHSQVQQAKVQLNQTREQKSSTLDGIKLEVKNAYLSMQEAEEKVSTQELTIKQAKEALRLAKLMYAEGASTQLDVLNANLSLKQARMNYQQSLLEYNLALADLKKAINEL
ncbi:MAG: TolC family protein [Candidatus Marinimicrobia bacterium]|nr:TolC family protein [Candidatus Neomarinimicrobiota bacterium]